MAGREVLAGPAHRGRRSRRGRRRSSEGSTNEPTLRRCRPEVAERGFVTSTYEAGELRRYWSYAATLAAGTGAGPAHPPVSEVASDFVAARPCFSLSLGTQPGRLPAVACSLPSEVAECV